MADLAPKDEKASQLLALQEFRESEPSDCGSVCLRAKSMRSVGTDRDPCESCAWFVNKSTGSCK